MSRLHRIEAHRLEILHTKQGMFNKDGVAYIIRGPNNTLRIYPKQEWLKLKKTHLEAIENGTMLVSLSRFVRLGMFRSKVDLYRQIEIPDHLYEYAELGSELKFTEHEDGFSVTGCKNNH